MAQIGRKIYYLLLTGVVLCDTGERQGDVVETTEAEDFATYPQLSGVDASTVSFLQLDYGARSDEFANLGSTAVDITSTPPTLIIYPHFVMTADKTTITPNGTDTVTITVTVADTATAHAIVFTSSTGTAQTINTASGVATLVVTSTSTEKVTITATSDLYGTGTMIITPATDTEATLLTLQTVVSLMDAAIAVKEGS
jgi:hypothetical protein